MTASAPPRALPRLLAISDRRQLADGDLVGWAERLERAGVGALQVRERDLSDRAQLELLHALRRRLAPPFLLLVNGRPDLAAAAGADGVHLPAAGLPPSAVRRRFGTAFLVGRSAHSVAEAAAAVGDGADYVLLGPIYETPSKMSLGAPLGTGTLAAAARRAPVLAVGGVTIERLPELAAAGAVGAAGIREFLREGGLAALVARATQCFSR